MANTGAAKTSENAEAGEGTRGVSPKARSHRYPGGTKCRFGAKKTSAPRIGAEPQVPAGRWSCGLNTDPTPTRPLSRRPGARRGLWSTSCAGRRGEGPGPRCGAVQPRPSGRGPLRARGAACPSPRRGPPPERLRPDPARDPLLAAPGSRDPASAHGVGPGSRSAAPALERASAGSSQLAGPAPAPPRPPPPPAPGSRPRPRLRVRDSPSPRPPQPRLLFRFPLQMPQARGSRPLPQLRRRSPPAALAPEPPARPRGHRPRLICGPRPRGSCRRLGVNSGGTSDLRAWQRQE
ncbi:basic proline-rich protein-like [Talpa occidentalis]|uniref:basic proline-rich protein-like n=1 Tax=Talpa occidentalis TaxID=50954 RepID=UPI00188E6897|nr:basic proline-rich protein-like [Talpa occidentalis]